MIRVLVADDHPIVRAGLRGVFAAAEDIEVVAEVARAEDAVAWCSDAAHPRVDVVTMDLQFGGPDVTDGATATAQLRELGERAPFVLVLTNYDTDADILTAITAGAAGYLLKDANPETLIEGVRDAARGRAVYAETVAERLAEPRRAPGRLSQRELEVLLAVARGATNAAIAKELFLTETTVKSHLAHIYAKLGVSSRTAAVAKAREQGQI